jgi:hypothetical protein
MRARVTAKELKILPTEGAAFNYKYLAHAQDVPISATNFNIILGTRDPNPSADTFPHVIYLPACISAPDINISKIGVPKKTLDDMSKILKILDDGTPESKARATALSTQFASYFFTDKNRSGKA